jgi:RHS repeat-associated protein
VRAVYNYNTNTTFAGTLTSNFHCENLRSYLLFGTTSYRAGRSETEVSHKRYKYCGKERDEESGLYYYGARYYASWICRWISTDPMKEQRTWVNPYNYCQNNPITRTDPTGALDNDPPKVREVFNKSTTTNEYTENGTTFRSVENSTQYGLHISDGTSELKYAHSSSTQELYQFSAPTGTWELVSSNETIDSYMEINSGDYSLEMIPSTELTGLDFVKFGLDIGSSGATIAEIAGNLSDKLDALNQGKFLTNYKGVEKAWSLGFKGNQSVSSSLVAAEKAKFLTNVKLLKGIKYSGKALGGIGALISSYQMWNAPTTSEKIEHGMDAVMSTVGVFGGLSGAAASMYYFYFAKPFYPVMWQSMQEECIRRVDAAQRGSWGEAVIRPGRK